MIKNFLKLFLAVGLVCFATISCEPNNEPDPKDPNTENPDNKDPENPDNPDNKDPENPDNPNPDEPDGGDFMSKTPFALTAEQITQRDFLLDIKAGDYDSQYYLYITTKEDFDTNFEGDVDSLVNFEIWNIGNNQLEVTDFSAVDNWAIYKGDNKVEVSKSGCKWGYRLFEPGMEVSVFVFGVNDIGELTTKPAHIDVKLEALEEVVDAVPAVEVVKVHPTSVDVKVTPEEGVNNYIVFAVPSQDFAEGGFYTNREESTGVDRYSIAADEYLQYTVRYFSTIDFTDVDQVDLFSGVQETNVSSVIGNNAITPGVKYTVVTVGINEFGYANTKAGHVDFTAGAEAFMDLTFEVKFNEYAFTEDGFAFQVYPSDKSAKYYVNVAEKSVIDALGGADDPEAVLAHFEEYGIDAGLTYGDITDWRRFSGLSVNTDYYVVLFGYSGGLTSDITLVSCKTGIVQ